MTKEVKAPTKTAKAKKASQPKRKKVPAGVLTRLAKSGKKAETAISTNKKVPAIEQKAMAGIAAVVAIVGTTLHNEGKLTPFGHMVNRQNGQLDMAILAMKPGDTLTTLVAKVIKAECTSRKTDVKDNKGIVKRLQSHLKCLGGKKANSKTELPNRLAKVGRKADVGKITAAMKPVSDLFDHYVAAGQF